MPSIIETFGEDRNIDVNLTINHNFIQEVAGETHINPTSLQFDKKGNIKFTLNFGGILSVQNLANSSQWDAAMNFYGTLAATANYQVIEPNDPAKRQLKIQPKSVQFVQFKLF